MNFRVLGDKVLVKVTVDEGETRPSGIIIPGNDKERKYEGKIVQVGGHPDIAKENLKVGDYVFYARGLNTEIVLEGVTYDIVSFYDISCVAEE